jgi:glycosyltransferase involved in cell wall biosynthesis
MHVILRCLLIVDWTVACLWLFRTLHWLRGISQVPDLAKPDYAASSEAAFLSVIVPACNEEKAIAACLESLLASTGIRLDIIAIDDRSTDATGSIMDSIAARQVSGHSLRVIHIDSLPEGWMGKTHAMARAAVEAAAEWILFTDGDMIFRPDALARVMTYAQREAADHVILYPTMIFKTIGERMMISLLHAMSIWGMRPWKVSDPASKKDFIGIGAFNLLRRSAYDAVGGWGALRLEVLEDLRMGFTIKSAGFRQCAVFGRDLTRIRWAEGALGVVNGMTKNLFAVFRFRLVVASLAVTSLVPLCLLPFAGLLLGWAGVAPFVLTSGSLAALYGRNHRLGLPGVLYALTFPIGSALFIFAITRSILITLVQGGVNWRGTFYPLKELRKHAGPLR